MGKLYIHSPKRPFAKQTPEWAEDYFLALETHPGLYFLLLEPVFAEEVIIDFNVLAASNAYVELEGGESLKNKKISTGIPSVEQWFDSCKLAFRTGEPVYKNVSYPGEEGITWYKATFYKQRQWVVCSWQHSDVPSFLEEKNAKHFSDSATNGHSPGNGQDDGFSLQELSESARQTVQADTIRYIIHEIRNPLTAIGLANQLLIEINNEHTSDDLSLKTITSIIFQNSRKIEDYLRQLIAAGPQQEETKFNAIELCKVVETALQKAGNRLFLSRVKVNRNFKPGYFINGNASKLCTAFLNIIINAIEAMGHEGGQLWVSVLPFRDKIKLIIRDNGTGMETDTLQRIFEPYFSNKKNGLGIGLTNVKQILDMHEAPITVNSVAGKGTSFTILFPSLHGAAKSKTHPVQYKMDF